MMKKLLIGLIAINLFIFTPLTILAAPQIPPAAETENEEEHDAIDIEDMEYEEYEPQYNEEGLLKEPRDGVLDIEPIHAEIVPISADYEPATMGRTLLVAAGTIFVVVAVLSIPGMGSGGRRIG